MARGFRARVSEGSAWGLVRRSGAPGSGRIAGGVVRTTPAAPGPYQALLRLRGSLDLDREDVDRDRVVLTLAAAGTRGVAALVADADVLAVAAAVDGRRCVARHGAVDVADIGQLAHAGVGGRIDVERVEHG